MSLRIPDGTGVISRTAPAGKVFAFYATLFATGAIAAVAILVFLGVIPSGHESEARAAVHQKSSTGLEQKVEQIAKDVSDMKAEQANEARDIAVIMRQLGLDGRGPPPVRASGAGQ